MNHQQFNAFLPVFIIFMELLFQPGCATFQGLSKQDVVGGDAQNKNTYQIVLSPLGFDVEVPSIKQPQWSYQQHVGHLQVALDEDTSMKCFYYMQDIALAQLLHTFVQTAVKNVLRHDLVDLQASQIAGRSYLAAVSHIEYPNHTTGTMMYFVARTSHLTSVCLAEGNHTWDLFQTTNLHMLQHQHPTSNVVDEKQSSLRWRGIFEKSSKDGMKGIVEKRIYQIKEGHVTLSFEHYIGVDHQKQLRVLDRYIEEFSDDAGHLLQGRVLENVGDELISDIQLILEGQQSYRLQGIRSKQTIEKTVAFTTNVYDWFHQYQHCQAKPSHLSSLDDAWTMLDVESHELFEPAEISCFEDRTYVFHYPGSTRKFDLLVDEEGFPLRQKSDHGLIVRQWRESFIVQ